jgi:methylenetetrahydrofolate dehydrogenase (NADP+)/methenyltetrahydrofolate cyclohydrolase
MTQLLLALPIRKRILKQLRLKFLELTQKNISPTLKVILVGENPASVIYTENKKRFCEKIGINCEIVKLAATVLEDDFLSTILKYNTDKKVHGLIIQLPLPKHLSHIDIGPLVSKIKDVDGFNPENLYQLLKGNVGNNHFISCTPKGILTLLNEYEISIEGKNICIIGRSMIVGKPLALLLTNNNATVTICHSQTKNLREITKNSEIIISAIGRPGFIDESFISQNKNQTIIDVGVSKNSEGKSCGDVNFDKVAPLVKAITPVPGGVGPMTVISLAQNLLQAAEKEIST